MRDRHVREDDAARSSVGPKRGLRVIGQDSQPGNTARDPGISHMRYLVHADQPGPGQTSSRVCGAPTIHDIKRAIVANMQPFQSRRRLLLIGAWVTWVACAALHWTSGAPLGHDEARYSIAARDLLAGDDSRWNYVPPAMEVIAVPGVLLGGGERALRVVPILFSLAFLLVVGAIAKRVGSDDSAAWTLALVAATGPIVRMSSDLLSDVPSTTLLLIAAFVVFEQLLRSEGPTKTMLWAAPASALAFYLRYGSCIPLAIIGGLAIVGCSRGILRRPLIPLATLFLFLLLLAPHFVHAKMTTGSMLGTLRLSATVPKGFGVGIGQYATHPVEYLGPFTVALVPFALAFGLNTRVRLMLLALALLDVLSLGIQTSAQARYVFLATSIILILGPIALMRAVARAACITRVKRAVAALAVAGVLAGWILQVVAALRYRSVRVGGMVATIQAAAAIRADVHGGPCYVLGRHDTQLEWYTRCEYRLVLPPTIDKPLYAVWDNTGGPWQPNFRDLPQPQRTVLSIAGALEVVCVQ